MTPIIFHIDVNSAFLSWTAVEQLKNGAEVDLRTIPSIIGGDQKSRHGIVLAKSLAAKAYGIRTGEPVANALTKCPNLTFAKPDHRMYQQKSRELMDYLMTYTPEIQQVSVDECYMNFTGIASEYESPVQAAIQIKDGVREKFGFTVNVGISSNKLLAKMASDFEKPDKVHTLFLEEIQEKMWPLPIGELFMAGRSSVEALRNLEIYTIGDLAKTDLEIIRLHLKKHGEMLWQFANGIGDAKVQSDEREVKGVGNSTTLHQDAKTQEEANHVLLSLAESVGRRLRKANQKAGMISVEIKYATFQKVSHQKQLLRATNADEIIYRAACELFQELWDGQPVRLLGIRSSKLVDEGEPEQLSLFDLQFTKPEDEKHKKLSAAMDQIRSRYGENAIVRGSLLKKERAVKKDDEDKEL
ncbi:MAG: DNA polymerase IV [Hespellia sp.]|nr:DNA polymerase IV [Hespellia sp.]